jgi:hypothetical protein
MSKKAGVEPPKPSVPIPSPSPQPEPEAEERPGAEDDDGSAPLTDNTPPRPLDDPNVPHGTKEAPKPAIDPKTGKPVKPNNWKVLNESLASERATVARLQKELTETRNRIAPEKDATILTERATKAEARAKELEDQIRYKDYESSTEFQEKYHGPYVKAWERAMKDLKGVPVIESDGITQRAMTAEDIQTLVGLDTAAAKAAAKNMFGDFAQEAMVARKQIRDLLEVRNDALESEKKNGATRVQQEQEIQKLRLKAAETEVITLAKTVYDEMLANDKISGDIKPIAVPEGQQATPEEKKHNDALTRGFSQFDKFWRLDPKGAKSAEERKAIIENQLAIRHRSAGFGPLKIQRDALKKRVTELETELTQYRSTTPAPPGGQARGGGPAPHAVGRDARVMRMKQKAGF